MKIRPAILTCLMVSLTCLSIFAADRDQETEGDPIAGAQLAEQMRQMVPATNR